MYSENKIVRYELRSINIVGKHNFHIKLGDVTGVTKKKLF